MYYPTMSDSCDPLLHQTTQRCHSVFSWRSPDGVFHDRLVASPKVATRLPPVVARISGSAPRFPIRVTLFKLRLTIPPGECRNARRRKYRIEPTRPQTNRRASSSLVARTRTMPEGTSQFAAKHECVFHRLAIILRPATRNRELPRGIQGLRRGVRLAHLEEHHARPPFGGRLQGVIQQPRADAASAHALGYREVRDLGLVHH